jgi:hypothetical protein
MRWTRTLLTVIAGLAIAPTAQAATFRVTGAGDAETASCSGTDCSSIRAAVAAAALSAGPDTVLVPPGDYQLAQGQLVLGSDVTLTGGGARVTTIRGNPSTFRVLEVSAGVTAAVAGVTLRDGWALFDNGSFRPGGVVANRGDLTLERVRVTGGNASSGGGIANLGGRLTVERSLIDGNDGGQDAGGLLNFGGGDVVVRNTTIAFNRAAQGGGYLSWGGTEARRNAGLLEHVTIARNSADFTGAAGFEVSQVPNGVNDTLRVRASVFAANSTTSGQPNCAPAPQNLGGTVESSDDCQFDVRGAQGAVAEALTNAGGDTDALRLLPSSPARDIVPGPCAADQRGVARPAGPQCDAGAVEAGSAPPIVTAPAQDSFTADPIIRITGTGVASGAAVLVYAGGSEPVGGTEADGQGAWSVELTDQPEGARSFVILAQDSEGQSAPVPLRVTVDTTRPVPTVADAAAEPGAATVTFGADAEPTATFACRLEGPGRGGEFTPCTSPVRYDGLAPGGYRFTVRATDAAGNGAESAPRDFVVPAPAAVEATPVASPAATPTPRPTATPTPTPERGETIVTRPVSGKVLIRVPGSTQFVELKSIDDIPLGATIDTRAGRVQIRFETEPGKVQTGLFYGGIFLVRQVGKVLDLKLTEPLAACSRKGKAAAAKAKKRRLWGDGKGSFRTSGKYSAATVRGTRWLVEDSCAGTLTRVTAGVVAVRDRGLTVLVRAGRSYLARARR